MTNVIDFQSKRRQMTDHTELTRLLELSDQFDQIILETLKKGKVDPRDLAGILAHRLGTLISHFDNKQLFLDACIHVLNKQAKSDDKGA